MPEAAVSHAPSRGVPSPPSPVESTIEVVAAYDGLAITTKTAATATASASVLSTVFPAIIRALSR